MVAVIIVLCPAVIISTEMFSKHFIVLLCVILYVVSCFNVVTLLWHSVYGDAPANLCRCCNKCTVSLRG